LPGVPLDASTGFDWSWAVTALAHANRSLYELAGAGASYGASSRGLPTGFPWLDAPLPLNV